MTRANVESFCLFLALMALAITLPCVVLELLKPAEVSAMEHGR